MKTIYPLQDKRKGKRRVAIMSVAALLAAFAFFITSLTSPQLVSSVVMSVVRPIMGARNAATHNVSVELQSFRSNKSLVAENIELKEQLALTEAIKAERDMYRDDNIALREQMGKKPEGREDIVAKVLSKPGYSPYDTMIVDVGERDGVRNGATVFANDIVAIGSVQSVTARTATIILFSSPGQKTDIMFGTTSLQSTAIGKGAGNFELKLPRNSGVQIGDSVHKAGTAGIFIGRVGIVSVLPSDTYELVLFRSPVDINRLSYVLIEK